MNCETSCSCCQHLWWRHSRLPWAAAHNPARPHISVSLPLHPAQRGVHCPQVAASLIANEEPLGAVGPGPRTYYDGSDRSANSRTPAQQCLHRSSKWQRCSQYRHCPSLRRAARGILPELGSRPKFLKVFCCNAAVNAPGPIPSGPFPRQNPASRDADRARFVKGSLQSFASCWNNKPTNLNFKLSTIQLRKDVDDNHSVWQL